MPDNEEDKTPQELEQEAMAVGAVEPIETPESVEPVAELPPKPVVEVIPAPEGYETVVKDDVTYYVKGETTLRQYGDKLVSVTPLIYREPTPPIEVTGKVEEAQLSVGAIAGKEVAEEVHPELVALVESGAPALEIWELANRTSGSYAAGITKQLASQFEVASELTGEARVEASRALQILPEGFDELPQELKTAYAEGDEAFSAAVDVYNARLETHLQLVTGEWVSKEDYIQVPGGWFSKEDLARLKEEDYEQYQALVSGAGIPEAEALIKRRTAEFEATLKDMPAEYQQAYKEGGYEGYIAFAEQKKAEFETNLKDMPIEAQTAYAEGGAEGYSKYMEDNYTQLPDNQHIDNEQLARIKRSDPDIYTILTTQGVVAANKVVEERKAEIQKQQDAVAQLDKEGYKVTSFSEAKLKEEMKELAGLYAVAEIRKKRDEIAAGVGGDIEGHNVIAYLRDNPDQLDLPIAAGYDADEVARLNEATKATGIYWTPDGKLDVYAAYIAGIDLKHLEALTGRTEDEIKGLPPSLRGFKQSYAVTHPVPDYPLPKKFLPSLQRMKAWVDRDRAVTIWHKEAGMVYAGIYGRDALSNAMNIEVATYAFAPARALEPRVTLKDLTQLEWIIGGAQIALYTAPIWLPRVWGVIKPLSKLERYARTAGNARLEVNIARREMLSRAWNDPTYARFASNLQHQIQASMKADRVFLNKLASLSKINPRQLITIENLSGIKGLAGLIKDVGVARALVIRAWDVIDKSKYYPNPTTVAQIAANESYLTNLGLLQTAQNSLANALAKAGGVLTPAYQLAPMAGWQNVIADTEKEIMRLNTEMAKVEKIIDKGGLPATIKEAREYWLGIRDQLTSVKGRLNTYLTASAAGKTPPAIAQYMIVDKTPTRLAMDRYDALQTKLDDYYRGIGKLRPTPAGGVATMERTLTTVEAPRGIMEVGFRPQYALVTAPSAIVPVPAVIAPAVGVAALPSIGVLAALVAPQIKVSTRTTTQTMPVSRILTMTPEQAQRIYGDEILVAAVSPLLIPIEKLKPGQWLSPLQAIEVAQKIAIQSYVQQITQSAIRQSELLKTQGATQAAIQSAVQQAIQSQIKTIVSPAVKAQVVTALQAVTAIQPIVTPGFWATIVPITPITPIIPIIPPPLPSVDEVSVLQPIELGSIAWRQGMYWKYIPPPYDMDKPLTLPRGVAPKGARLGGRTPQETIQMIGTSRAVVPESISIDLGIVDAFITNRGRNIEFRGKGELTDVGERIPLTTQGMSVDGAYPGRPVSGERISRPVIKKKKPKRVTRRRDDFSDILEVRGEV